MHPRHIKAQDNAFIDLRNNINLYSAFLLGCTVATSIVFHIAKHIDKEKTQLFFDEHPEIFNFLNGIGNVGLFAIIIMAVATGVVKVANFVAPDNEYCHCGEPAEDTRRFRCH